jgi:hypothetical protein
MDRQTIEAEDDYEKLKAIAKDFQKDGHKIKLNVSKPILKAKLLSVFDEHYTSSEEEIESAPEEDIIELGEEENEPAIQADASEAEEEEKVEEKPEPIPEPKPEPKAKGEKLFYAPKGYHDWETDWKYTPGEKPKALPKKLSDALRNALKTGRILEYNE